MMFTVISQEKARLRDEAELAVMAWAELGRKPRRVENDSRARVNVPRETWAGILAGIRARA